MYFIDGPFKDVMFAINRVAIIKENVLDFHYDILWKHPQFVSNPEFEKELGDLVVYLFEKPDIKIGKNVTSTNSNPAKSHS